MQAYGPFLDEQLFHFTDKTVLTLDKFQLYDTSREEYIGFDDLQVIYDKGREGNFNRIFFTGIAVLEKVGSQVMLTDSGYVSIFLRLTFYVNKASTFCTRLFSHDIPP